MIKQEEADKFYVTPRGGHSNTQRITFPQTDCTTPATFVSTKMSNESPAIAGRRGSQADPDNDIHSSFSNQFKSMQEIEEES